MLPTYPKVCDLRRQSNFNYVKMAIAQMAPTVGLIQHNIQFEGRGHTIARADDSVSEVDMKPMSGEVRVAQGMRRSDFTPNVLQAHLLAMAKQMAQAASENFYETMDRGTRDAGMVVDAKGGPMTEELLLDALEKMEHSFDADGKWEPPTILVGKDNFDALKGSAMSESGQRRLAEILDRKRDAFRRRQAGRVLVG